MALKAAPSTSTHLVYIYPSHAHITTVPRQVSCQKM